jgi:hypothetical protein
MEVWAITSGHSNVAHRQHGWHQAVSAIADRFQPFACETGIERTISSALAIFRWNSAGYS